MGQHCLLEPDHCNSARPDDDAFLRDTLTAAAQRAGGTLLQLITRRFQPQGVTHLAAA